MDTWTKIRSDYITSGKTIRELSEEYKISRKTIGERCKKENWVEQKNKHSANKSKEIGNAVLKADIKQAKKDTVDAFQIAELCCSKLLETLLSQSEQAKTYTPTMQQAYSKTLETTIKMIKDLRGILSPAEVARIDAMQRELAIKEEEHKKFMEQDSIAKEPITIRIENEDLERYAK